MISFLKGTIAYCGDDFVDIDVSGVGFKVFIPTAAFDNKLLPGDEITLYTYMQVREDDISLFGFADREQLMIFNMLTAVSGIGAKTALQVLNILPPQGVIQAIAMGDESVFIAVPGIGKKTAGRLVLELRDKCAKLMPQVAKMPATEPAIRNFALNDTENAAVSALQQLGFNAAEAKKLVAQASGDLPAGVALEEILTKALRLADR